MPDWHLNHTYRSAQGEIRWDRSGNPGGEAVVLVHGTPFSSFIWREIVDTLAPHHLVYMWDMPGYGLSEKSERQDLSLSALGEVFSQLLEYWQLDEPSVIAHDSGGAVALGAHILHGAKYRRLALVDAVALSPWGSPFFRLVGEHSDIFDRLPAELSRALIREYVNSASSPGLRPATREALIEPWTSDSGQSAFYRQIKQRLSDETYTDHIQNRYDTIHIPVLVCWGTDDTWIPINRGRELAEQIPTAQFREITGAGHLIQEDKPAQLATTLFAFLHHIQCRTEALI